MIQDIPCATPAWEGACRRDNDFGPVKNGLGWSRTRYECGRQHTHTVTGVGCRPGHPQRAGVGGAAPVTIEVPAYRAARSTSSPVVESTSDTGWSSTPASLAARSGSWPHPSCGAGRHDLVDKFAEHLSPLRDQWAKNCAPGTTHEHAGEAVLPIAGEEGGAYHGGRRAGDASGQYGDSDPGGLGGHRGDDADDHREDGSVDYPGCHRGEGGLNPFQQLGTLQPGILQSGILRAGILKTGRLNLSSRPRLKRVRTGAGAFAVVPGLDFEGYAVAAHIRFPDECDLEPVFPEHLSP